jgi:phenylpropionate dioxygenase-like ring-hydroxylating dioxygenase large terminal subunit
MYDSRASSNTSGLSLARRFYIDEGVYQGEIGWLRRNMWLLVGHESQIPNIGDYFLFEFDQENIIVIRHSEAQIKAYFNVCRHRGSRICMQTSGTVRTLTCPYHAWSYGLDGELRAAPFTDDTFDKAEYALVSCQIRQHGGLIFLSFAAIPPDFEAHIGFLTRELELQNVRRSKVARRALFQADANWKLVVQNNLECYHCRPNHPIYCAAHPGASLGRPESHNIEWRYDEVRLQRSVGEEKRQFQAMHSDHNSERFQILTRQVIGDDFETESVGGKRVAPLMGQNIYNGVQTLALPSPLTTVVLNPDYAIFYSFTPRAPRRTDIEAIWLVRDSAIEDVDFSGADLVAVWSPTLREDKILAEGAQAGIESTEYRPGPYTLSEKLVSEFDDWYLRQMANAAIRP